ncbi:MAG: NAD(P)-dependent oxidoreductase [Pseudomonadota bacterium]|nr:NAD(P)-dependent oxidoreductase [Pseudomonadota bacterium]
MTTAELRENFADLHRPLSVAQTFVEASRCLYCYDAPCVSACPTGIDIPKFIHQIRSGNRGGSARTILSANIMGGTCARACPTEVLCEGVCVVNQTEGAPVKIGLLQRHAVDHAMAERGDHPFARAPGSGFRIAVVGAGPAGLSFAHRAACLGHQITIFDAAQKPGGLNEYGLAAYKMVDDFAQAEVAFILGVGGITIETGCRLGVNLDLATLRRSHDAVFLGIGLGKALSLDVPGTDLSGVCDALAFIGEIRRAPDKGLVRIGRHVIVIGGGNTAIDAAVQAKNLGAATVTVVYRRGKAQMSATTWEQEFASRSGVVFQYWSSPVAFTGMGGTVTAVKLASTQTREGQLVASEETYTLPADMVLVAIGQTLDERVLDGLKICRGKIRVDESYRTSLAGVYAGGDCIKSGEDLTVQAVEDGKRAAICVDAALRRSQEASA